MTRSLSRPVVRSRPPTVDFGTVLPRHWLGGQAVITHVVNGVNLLFPGGERFFIRTVARYLDRIGDPEQQAAVRCFLGQEGQHAQAHEAYFAAMEAQGYRIRPFLALYERIAFGIIEPLTGPEMRLATTAACEHFTAILAADVFERRLLDLAPESVRDLLYWHAAEELEHKHVAYDVLQTVDPRYGLRVAGLAMAVAILGGFWTAATLLLLWQDWQDRVPTGPADRRVQSHIFRDVFLAGIADYLRPGFHPDQRDDRHLAQAYLSGLPHPNAERET
jgi:predicted metal-dependent hydrolase